MKVLQVITDTDRRGAQVFATDLAPALRRRGLDVETVALAPGRQPNGLSHPVLGERRLAPSTLAALRRRARGVDVVVAHGSSTLPACAAATVGSGVPFVYRQISESLFWAPDRLRQARVRAYLRAPRLVVTLAESQGRVLSRHFGVPPGRLRVVPNGVPAGSFAPVDDVARVAARARLDLPTDGPVFAAVGALVPEKGVDLALEAVAAVPGAHLLVAGDGPERDWLEREARRAAPRRVHFGGVLGEVGEAYAAADAVLLPSRGGDSMPATLIEAGLSGLPSVATDVGAIADVVVDGVTGVLVPRGDVLALARAVGLLAAEPPLAARLGAAARAHCLEHFTIDAVAAAWADVLAEASR